MNNRQILEAHKFLLCLSPKWIPCPVHTSIKPPTPEGASWPSWYVPFSGAAARALWPPCVDPQWRSSSCMPCRPRWGRDEMIAPRHRRAAQAHAPPSWGCCPRRRSPWCKRVTTRSANVAYLLAPAQPNDLDCWRSCRHCVRHRRRHRCRRRWSDWRTAAVSGEKCGHHPLWHVVATGCCRCCCGCCCGNRRQQAAIAAPDSWRIPAWCRCPFPLRCSRGCHWNCCTWSWRRIQLYLFLLFFFSLSHSLHSLITSPITSRHFTSPITLPTRCRWTDAHNKRDTFGGPKRAAQLISPGFCLSVAEQTMCDLGATLALRSEWLLDRVEWGASIYNAARH